MSQVRVPGALTDALSAARRVVVATGAGVSAESGIPTFRDRQTGLWSKYRPEDLATPQAFERNPSLVWDWYQWRRSQLCKVQPNPGHFALAALERLFPRFNLITQNVDGLHRAAGSRSLIEFHGNVQRNRCIREGTTSDWDPAETASPGLCKSCGAHLRPDVVWFGEALDPGVLTAAFEAASRADVFLSVGTSSVVEPAASLAGEAAAGGAFIGEINPERTPLSRHADIFLRGKSGEVLPAILDAVELSLA